MLTPKRTKFRRPHRVSYDGKAKGAKVVNFGEIGLRAEEGCWLTTNQIEASRVALTRYMKREGQVWIRVFPHMAYTRKPLEVRMGGGKGGPEGYVAVVKKGTVIFEAAGVSDEVAREAFRLAANKLPIRTKIVYKEKGE
jgi:large subunit ribosomal protein L16